MAEEDEEPTKEGKKKLLKKSKKKAEEVREQAEQDSEEDGAEEGDEDEDDEGVKAKPRKTKVNRLKEAEQQQERQERGVIFIKQLPVGMEENELKMYFRQFGEISRWKLGRSLRTGGSKGHCWVEFKDREVAEIVAKTMDKYMVFGKVLKVRLMPREEVPPHFFYNWKVPVQGWLKQNREDFKSRKNFRPKVEVDGEVVPQRTLSQVKRRAQNLAKLKEKLERHGIDYDLTPFEEGEDEDVQRAEASWQAKKEKREKEEAAREEAKKGWQQQQKASKVKKGPKAAKTAAAPVGEPATGEKPLEADSPAAEQKQEDTKQTVKAMAKQPAKAIAKQPARPKSAQEAADAAVNEAEGKGKRKNKIKRKAEAEEEKAEDATGGGSGAASEDAGQKTPKKVRKRQAA